jgi:hypothetical protein
LQYGQFFPQEYPPVYDSQPPIFFVAKWKTIAKKNFKKKMLILTFKTSETCIMASMEDAP